MFSVTTATAFHEIRHDEKLDLVVTDMFDLFVCARFLYYFHNLKRIAVAKASHFLRSNFRNAYLFTVIRVVILRLSIVSASAVL